MNKHVTQTPVLVKIDSNQLALLDDLCSQLDCKCNKLINFAIKSCIEGLKNPRNLVLTHIYSSIEF